MTKMVQKNTISNNVIGGIAAAVAAVFTLKTVVDYIQSMEYLPEYYTVGGLLWNLLTLAALAFLAVMLLMKKRSALIAVGFGVMAVGELRALLTPHLSFANRLAELLMTLALVGITLMAAALLSNALPALRDTARKAWFVPAVCVVAAAALMFLSYVWELIFGWFEFGLFLRLLFTLIISYGLVAAVLLFSAAWFTAPEGQLLPTLPKAPVRTAPAAGASYGTGGTAGYQGPSYNPGPAPSAAPGELEPETYCKLSTHVLLLIFTFGIWYFIWIYRTTRRLNCVADEPPRDPVKKLLLCMFVPFYGIYWIYKSAQRIDKLAAAKGISSDLSTLCLILAIFVGIIPPILMQDKLNAIVVTKAPMGDMPFSPPQQPQQPQAAPYQPPVQSPPRPQAAPVVQDAADEIRKYKELLDSGILTQEEFDRKKAQLLDL